MASLVFQPPFQIAKRQKRAKITGSLQILNRLAVRLSLYRFGDLAGRTYGELTVKTAAVQVDFGIRALKDIVAMGRGGRSDSGSGRQKKDFQFDIGGDVC